MSFSENLKKFRRAKGLTQQQVANELGITKATYSGYETGRREPDVSKIKALARLLDITGDDLIGTEFAKEKSPEPAATDSEAIRRMQLLINSFEAAGYVRPGEDLTDEQLRFCMALVDFLDTYFSRST